MVPDTDEMARTAGAGINPVLDHARVVAFLVTGREKAPIVKKKKFNGSGESLHYPIQRFNPYKGHKFWFLERNASYLLNDETTADQFQNRIARLESNVAISH